MRIGFQVGRYPAPSESWTELEIQGLRAAGHEVLVSAMVDKHPTDLSECDFVVCHFAVNAGYADQFSRPFLLIPHAYDIWPTNGQYLMHAVQNYRHLRAVGCVSHYHWKRYVEWGVPKHLLVDYPTAVDTERFARKRPGLGDLVIAGGRNVEKKGLGLALSAWPDVMLFGEHPKAIGWLSWDELADLMDRSWCYLGTFQVDRRGDMDGLPHAVLEAGAASLRVVTTKIAGLSDLEGLVTFVEPTVEAIREAIQNEPHEPNEMFRDYVRKRHPISAVLQNILYFGKAVT